jgi:hypothetical protein
MCLRVQKSRLLVGIIVTLASLAGHAYDAPSQLELGTPSYGGTGCPDRSVAASLSPGNTALTLLFDEYVVEAGSNGKSLDRKSCNLSIPIRVPQGYSMSVLKVDYRGYVFVPRGGRAVFDVEYFFAGSRGPRISEVMSGPTDRNYMITDELLARAVVWSACGAETNLRINTGLRVQTNRQRDDAIATLDSTDVDTKVIYHLQWKRCR